jgi:HK97 family phage prohead protease
MATELIERTFALDDFDIKRGVSGRTVTAYAAVFGQEAEIVDQHGHYFEGIHRSAFNKTLAGGIGRVNVFYNHGYDLSGKPNGLLAVPFATPVEIKPDGKGLLTISRYNDGELADAVLAAWDGGQIRGQSFRGRVHASRPRGKHGKLDRIERMELGLKEYGPTPSPAYEGAGLVMIRSQQELAELVRSMISEAISAGTPSAPPAERGATPSEGLSAAGDSSDDGHSSRSRQRRLAIARRAHEIGVTRNGQAPQEPRN